ncbi:protein kinase [Streptomyces sp. NPDC017248]|uniref:WD40 repeat domain-containing serine/threonine protein kinase n=1 Tax=unclassified Streptomyces TaxID=2593676 RepID=UPI00379E3060
MAGTDSSQGPRLVAGRYRLTEVLGRGGMGIVWRATDERIGRTVAVKELRVPRGLPAREQAAFGERALREARTAGRVRHPGVIAIHDLVPGAAQDDAVYVVMELVEAPSLATVLEEQGALPESRVARLGLRLLEALDAAHAIGLVHRDVKPSNILVLPDDKVKLVDFGIAHAVDDTRLTGTGVAGSTDYIAPELFEGHSPTPAADLWSLGVTLHHAATGRSPFERGTTAATIRAILHDDPPPLDRHPALARVIESLLVREPSGRMDGREGAVRLRAVIAAARDTAVPPVRQNTPPDEPAGRPVTGQNRPIGAHARATGAGRPSAATDTTGRAPASDRDAATGSPGQPSPDAVLRRPQGQPDGGGSRPVSWDERPTSVRNTASSSRSTARSRPAVQTSTTATDDGPERYLVFPAKTAGRLNHWTSYVLFGLVVWLGWRLGQLLDPVLLVLVLCTSASAVSIVALVTLSPRWSFSIGAEGIGLFRVGRGTSSNPHVALAWEHIDEVLLMSRRPTSRTAITLHMAATTPADVRSRPPLRGVVRTGGSGLTWRMGQADQPVADLCAAFRATAPLHVTISTPTESDAVDLRYHGTGRIWPTLTALTLVAILVATYAFTPHDSEPVRLTTAGSASAVEFAPSGKTFASSTDRSIELWDVATRKKTTTLSGIKGPISAMRFTPDGSLLAAADDDDDIDDHTIRVWDVTDGKERRTLRLDEGDTVVSLAFRPDSHTLAGVMDDGTIVIWDVRSGRTTSIQENRSSAFPVEFSANGRFLYGVDAETVRHRWDVASGRPVPTKENDENTAIVYSRMPETALVLDGSGHTKSSLVGHTDRITDIDWAGASSTLLATNSLDGTIRIWHTDTGETARKLVLDADHGSSADGIALSPDGTTLVYTSGRDLWIWETGIEA